MKTDDSFFDLSGITGPLLLWYAQNARVLPWRENPSPFRVCVSEIMLQQTRVETVKPYFERFIKALPDFDALANCEEDRLLKLWEGLGYYARAKNLHKTAKIVIDQYGGRLPESFDTLLSLPGFGEYTAGAVASIAFSLSVPAVDGNVLRVLSRITASDRDIGKPETKTAFQTALMNILPKDRPGDFNQALMELGATVCLPNGEPKCSVCPLSGECKGYRSGIAGILPVKARKKERKIENRTVLLLLYDKHAAILRRSEGKLLKALYELPNFDGHLSEAEIEDTLRSLGIRTASVIFMKSARHVFTHLEWHMKGYIVSLLSPSLPESWMLVNREALENEYALPSAFKVFREELFEAHL